MAERSLTVRVHERVSEVEEHAWDALVGERSSPFVEWGWLDALERAGCVVPERGWLPRHVVVWDGARPIAAAPCYIKGNSEGEFVFDHQWAAVAGRLGVEYYPKVIAAVPFTPATGDRLLVAPGEDRKAMRALLGDAIDAIGKQAKLSSAHVLFCTAEERDALESRGFAARAGVQFHWKNKGYSTFDDFLGSVESKRRHQWKRERRLVREQGIEIETRRAEAIDEQTIEKAYELYLATVDKFVWGRRYLNETFFRLLAERYAKKRDDAMDPKRLAIEVVLARRGKEIVGGAFNVAKGKKLYGRYWGATKDVPFLHFEVCFYHSIEECIARGFQVFEPGAGGEHKVRRGFDPTATWSAHRLYDPRLDRIVRDFLPRERAHVDAIVRGDEAGDDY